MLSITSRFCPKLRQAGLGVALFFLALCASAQIRVFELDNLPKTLDPEQGAVIMSLSFSQLFDSTESVALQFRPAGELPDANPLGGRPQTITTIAKAGGGLGMMRRDNMNLLASQGRFATLLMFIGKPGDYEFSHAQAFGYPDLGAIDPAIIIPFKLLAGQTRYVGNLHLHAVGGGFKSEAPNVRYTSSAGAASPSKGLDVIAAVTGSPIFGLAAMAAKLTRPLRLDYLWIDEFKRDMQALQELAPTWRAQVIQSVALSEIDLDHQRRLVELKNSPPGRGKSQLLLMLALRGYTVDLSGNLLIGPADRAVAIDLIKELAGDCLTPELAGLLLPYVGQQGMFARYVKEESLRLGFAADSAAFEARYVLKAAQSYDAEAISLVRGIRPTAPLTEKEIQLWRDRQALLSARVSKDPLGWGFSKTAELSLKLSRVPASSFSAIALDDSANPYLAVEETRLLAISKALGLCQQAGKRCVLQVFNSVPVAPSCANIEPSDADKQYFLPSVDLLATLASLNANGVDEVAAKRFLESTPPRALVRDTDSGKHFIIFRHCRAATVAANQCYASGAKSCEIVATDDAIVRTKVPAPAAVAASAAAN